MHLYGQFITKITTIMTYKITLQMQRTVYAKTWISLVDVTCKFVHLLQRLYQPFKYKHMLHVRRIFRCVRKIAKGDYWFRHVCLSARPSVRMEQFGSHWTDCHEILYLSIFRKSVHTIHVSLKYDRNNGYFALRPIYICNHISLNYSSNEKCFRQNL